MAGVGVSRGKQCRPEERPSKEVKGNAHGVLGEIRTRERNEFDPLKPAVVFWVGFSAPWLSSRKGASQEPAAELGSSDPFLAWPDPHSARITHRKINAPKAPPWLMRWKNHDNIDLFIIMNTEVCPLADLTSSQQGLCSCIFYTPHSVDQRQD